MKTKHKLIILVFIIIFTSALLFYSFKIFLDTEMDIAEEKKEPGFKITTFHYQLQNAEYSDLKALDVDFIIIDIDDANLDKSEILNLKKDKVVLSYLSIGEAENYRDYWQDSWKPGNPSFIGKENPDWEGNFKVMYWNKEWQDIILKKTEEIALKGYSGVYLDLIDAYEYYAFMSSIHSTKEMINFVKRIMEKGKQINPDFMVIPQNSPELYQYDEYKQIIDGFGKEDTWYDDNRLQDNKETEFVLEYLDKAIEDSKFVLAIDYPTEQNKICEFYKNCRKHKFTCTVANRDLDRNKPIVCSV